MFNATTHAGAKRALITDLIAVRRVGPRAFAVLIGIELAFVSDAIDRQQWVDRDPISALLIRAAL